METYRVPYVAAVLVHVCVVVYLLSPPSPPARPSEAKKPSRWGDVSIFHPTPTYYLISPGANAPSPLRPHRSNLQT